LKFSRTQLLVGFVVLVVGIEYWARLTGGGFQISLAGGDPSKDTLGQAMAAAQQRLAGAQR
jgi:hypothetical protein